MSEEMKFNVEAEVASKPRLKPIADKGNLCLGKLVSVEVVMNEMSATNADGSLKTWEFAGKTIPSLVFKYENHKLNANEADREFSYRESVIGTQKKDGSEIEVATLKNLYDQMWARIKHQHDVYSKLPNYAKFSEAVAKAGTALYTNGSNPKKTTESTIKAFAEFFTAVAAAFTVGANNKPVYKDAKGESAPVWLKLLADYSTQKFLTFPTFVGDGFIELYKANVEPAISIKATESIILSGGKGTPGAAAPALAEDIDPEVAKLLNMQQ